MTNDKCAAAKLTCFSLR